MSVFELKVCRAKNLMAKDANGLSDPYLRIKWGHLHQGGHAKGKREIAETEPIEEELNPIWTDASWEIDITKDGEGAKEIFVDCWDQDKIGKDDFLGRVVLRFEDFVVGELSSKWYKMETRKDKKTGRDKEQVYQGEMLIQGLLRKRHSLVSSGLMLGKAVENDDKEKPGRSRSFLRLRANDGSPKGPRPISPFTRKKRMQSDDTAPKSPVSQSPPRLSRAESAGPATLSSVEKKSTTPVQDIARTDSQPPILIAESQSWTQKNTREIVKGSVGVPKEFPIAPIEPRVVQPVPMSGTPTTPTKEKAAKRVTLSSKSSGIFRKLGSSAKSLTSGSRILHRGDSVIKFSGFKQSMKTSVSQPLKGLINSGNALFMHPNESARIRSEDAKNQDLYPGLFRITVKEAIDLPNAKDVALGITLDERNPNPQLKLQYDRQNFMSSTIKWSTNPNWNESFLFDHAPSSSEPLCIDVYNNEPLTDLFMGRVMLDLSKYSADVLGTEAGCNGETIPHELVLPLKPRSATQLQKGGGVQGKLRLTIEGRVRRINDTEELIGTAYCTPPYGSYDLLLFCFIILFTLIWVL